MKPCFFYTEFQLQPTFPYRLYRIPRLFKETEIKVRGIIFLSNFYAQSKVAKNPFDFINLLIVVPLFKFHSALNETIKGIRDSKN